MVMVKHRVLRLLLQAGHLVNLMILTMLTDMNLAVGMMIRHIIPVHILDLLITGQLLLVATLHYMPSGLPAAIPYL